MHLAVLMLSLPIQILGGGHSSVLQDALGCLEVEMGHFMKILQHKVKRIFLKRESLGRPSACGSQAGVSQLLPNLSDPYLSV